jgi:tellurite resistance protein
MPAHMPKTLNLQLPAGLEFSPNLDAEITAQMKDRLGKIYSWIFNGDQALLIQWESLTGKVDMTGVLATNQMGPVLKELKAESKSNDLQLSLYKYVFAACLASPRHPKELLNFLKNFKEVFRVDVWESTLVHDAILAEIPLVGCAPWQITDGEKIKVVALACLLLRLDGATHILETEMLRAITASMRSGATPPAALMAEMGKSTQTLLTELAPQGVLWATLFLLRMGCADGALRPKEREFIEILAQALGQHSKESLELLDRVVWLETGIKFMAAGANTAA